MLRSGDGWVVAEMGKRGGERAEERRDTEGVGGMGWGVLVVRTGMWSVKWIEKSTGPGRASLDSVHSKALQRAQLGPEISLRKASVHSQYPMVYSVQIVEV